MQQIEQEVRQFVIENFVFGNDSNHFSNDDSFLEKGLVDSMGILTLVEFVSEKFAISVPDEDLIPEHWDSVARIGAYVQSRIGKAQTSNQLTTAASVTL
jgi:acyl carrier protein